MGGIVVDAKRDAVLNGVHLRIIITQLSYHDFLCEYDPAALESRIILLNSYAQPP